MSNHALSIPVFICSVSMNNAAIQQSMGILALITSDINGINFKQNSCLLSLSVSAHYVNENTW